MKQHQKLNKEDGDQYRKNKLDIDQSNTDGKQKNCQFFDGKCRVQKGFSPSCKQLDEVKEQQNPFQVKER